MKYLILITTSPHHAKHKQALAFVQEHINQHDVSVFFYGDGAYVANRLVWQTADVPNLADAWIDLHRQHDLALPVCVSTALARGITDESNAKRHGLMGENIRTPFYLTGLSTLALGLDGVQLLQF